MGNARAFPIIGGRFIANLSIYRIFLFEKTISDVFIQKFHIVYIITADILIAKNHAVKIVNGKL